MCTLARVIFVVLCGLDVLTLQADSADLVRLQTLVSTPTITVKELEEGRELLASLQINGKKPDDVEIAMLFSILENEFTSILAPDVLCTLCRGAETESAIRVVHLVSSWIHDLKLRPVSQTDSRNAPLGALLNAFFDCGAVRIDAVLNDRSLLLQAVVDATMTRVPLLRPPAQQAAWKLISDGASDVSVRKAFAGNLIRESGSRYPYPSGFEELFGPDDAPSLRQLIRSPNDTPERFCWGAADILAHLGDRLAVADVRNFLMRYPPGSGDVEVAVRAYAFRIELQHPPARLLEFVRGNTSNGTSRVWAIRRALHYGLEKSGVREAILAHAEIAKDNALLRAELWKLKNAAIDLGILTASDLPHVVVPSRLHVTP